MDRMGNRECECRLIQGEMRLEFLQTFERVLLQFQLLRVTGSASWPALSAQRE